jgi:hypothetical protein
VTRRTVFVQRAPGGAAWRVEWYAHAIELRWRDFALDDWHGANQFAGRMATKRGAVVGHAAPAAREEGA